MYNYADYYGGNNANAGGRYTFPGGTGIPQFRRPRAFNVQPDPNQSLFPTPPLASNGYQSPVQSPGLPPAPPYLPFMSAGINPLGPGQKPFYAPPAPGAMQTYGGGQKPWWLNTPLAKPMAGGFLGPGGQFWHPNMAGASPMPNLPAGAQLPWFLQGYQDPYSGMSPSPLR